MSDSVRSAKAIIYLTFATLPSPTAHSVQIVKMCQAMAKAGAGVKLVADVRQRPRQVFEFYDVRYPFEIIGIRLLPVRIVGRVVFLARSFFLILKNRHGLAHFDDLDGMGCRRWKSGEGQVDNGLGRPSGVRQGPYPKSL